ncbi:hypothetical protein A4A49_51406 [Nicotiana attenuata]|uniref:Retrotransposon gag domain-containing protein n=1 Tax=Nicotiana attenuata TaxID=49451 RepID=A0A314KKN3_NICAT|nr:hypothetical protein A4A49_51406 [Nicotiana attenuata]
MLPQSLEASSRLQISYDVRNAISGGNTPFSMFHKLSQTASNLGGFEDLVDSSVSTKFNALMTNTTNMDEKFAMMEQTIEVLKKSVEDKNLQIAQLMNKLEPYAPGESSHVPHLLALSVQQLQDMITNTIKAQYGGPSQSSLYYSKPYTKGIDCLTMPTNYQPPKLHQFDGKGNPRQYIAHFVETCSNAGTHGDILVKQFIRSLEGNTFGWYIDLEPESIDSWEQLEKEFLNHFYSTRRTVSMIELTGTKQRKDEPVVDTLSLEGVKFGLQRSPFKNICCGDVHSRNALGPFLSIASHGKLSPFADQKEFKKNVASKNQTKESVAVKATPVKVTTKQKEKRRPTLKELKAKVYPFPDSDVPTILDEQLDKKVIDLPESKRPEEIGKEKIMAFVSEGKIIIHMDETAEENHASVALKEKKCSKLHNVSRTAFLQFGSFKPVEVDLPRKTLEGSLDLDNHSKDKDDEGWILVTHKKRKHQAVLRLRILNSRAMMSNADKLQSPRNIKSSIIKKINGAYRRSSESPSHCMNYFLENSFMEVSNDELALMKTHEHHDNEKVVICCATISFTDVDLLVGSKPHSRPLFVVGSIREQHLNRIHVDNGSAVNIMPKMVSKSNLTIQGFNQGGQRAIGMIRVGLSIGEMNSNTLIHVIDAKTSFNLLLGRPWIHENGVVSSTLHQCLKYRRDGKIVKIDADIKPFTEMESYSADSKFYLDSCEPKVEKPSPDDEADLPKKGTKEVSIKLSSFEGDIQTKTEEHLVFRYVPHEHRKKGQPLLQDEHMTLPVAQIPPLTCESAKGNLQANKIKGHYDPKAFILLEREHEDEVTSEKIHGLNESQMKLRKLGNYVATPKLGLGFSLAEPLRISSNRSKEIASSQYTSVEEMKEVKGKKIKQRASVFDRIGGSTPPISVFERLSHKGEHVSSKHLKEVSTQDLCLLSPRDHKEERDHLEVVADKEICSAFPSRMKRKSILSISADGPAEGAKKNHCYTCQPHKEAEKEKEAMPTIQGSQTEKSDFLETSYHITVEGSPCLAIDDEVHEDPHQLEDGGQSTVDELKELNLGTPEDPRPTFISALLTPQEEEEYSKLLNEYKDVFSWSYKEMPGLIPKVFVHHLGIKSGTRLIVSQIEVEVIKLIEAGFI